MRLERSICPLTMLVERSNAYRGEHLSERSIVPLRMLLPSYGPRLYFAVGFIAPTT